MSIAKKEKIFFIEFGIGFGGSVISLSELIKGFDKLDLVDATVLTFQDEEVTRGLFGNNVTLLTHKRLFSYRKKQDFSQWIERNRLLRPLKPLLIKVYVGLDIVHDFYLTCLLTWMLRKYKAKVLHINNGWEMVAIRAAKWANIPCFIHLRYFAIEEDRQLVERYSHTIKSVVKGYIAISDSVSEAAVKNGADANLITTIFNPLDLELYGKSLDRREDIRASYDLTEDHVVFGIFGRITSWKGQLECLQAVSEIIDRCPNMMLMIVGDASDTDDISYERRVMDLIQSDKLRERVILTGYQNEVYNFYAAVDVVVHCSTSSEPFGRVVIEGMGAENAVVAMDEGGPKEIVEHGVDGLLVEPRNILKLSEALEKVYNDEKLRAQLSQNAMKKIAEEYRNDLIAKKVFDFYRECGV